MRRLVGTLPAYARGLVGTRLPGVILGCGPATGEDLIEAVQMLRRQRDLYGSQSALELVTGSRPDDWCGDRGPGEQPGKAQDTGLRADLIGQVLVRLDLVPILSEAVRCAALESPDAGVCFLITPPNRPPCSGDQG